MFSSRAQTKSTAPKTACGKIPICRWRGNSCEAHESIAHGIVVLSEGDRVQGRRHSANAIDYFRKALAAAEDSEGNLGVRKTF
jgi:hypothetical protein